jgi:hypothetical protein
MRCGLTRRWSQRQVWHQPMFHYNSWLAVGLTVAQLVDVSPHQRENCRAFSFMYRLPVGDGL